MNKIILILLGLSWGLSACARPDAGPHSRSGVQVYGTIDTGVGYTKQTTTHADGSKSTSTQSGFRY